MVYNFNLNPKALSLEKLSSFSQIMINKEKRDAVCLSWSKNELILIEENKEAIGYCVYNSQLGFIDHIEVKEAHEGMGLEKLFLDYVINQFELKGISIIKAKSKYQDSMKFWQDLGFSISNATRNDTYVELYKTLK